MRVAFRLRTVRVHWHRHRTGGFCGLEVYLRRCCGAAAAAGCALRTARPSLQVAAAARAVGGRNIGAPLAMLSS